MKCLLFLQNKIIKQNIKTNLNANVKDGLRDQDTDKMSDLRLFGMDLADHKGAESEGGINHIYRVLGNSLHKIERLQRHPVECYTQSLHIPWLFAGLQPFLT